MDDAAWTALALALTIVGGLYTWRAYRRRGLAAGMRGAGLTLLVPAAWLSYQNDGLLAHRVAQLLPLGGSAVALVAVTALIAGLAGGLAALAGVWLRVAFRPTPQVR